MVAEWVESEQENTGEWIIAKTNKSISMTIKNILISDKTKQNKKKLMADSQQHLGSQSIHTDAMNQSYNSIWCT